MTGLRRIVPALAGAIVSLAALAFASPASASGCTVQSTTSVSYSAYNVFSASNDLSTAGAVKIVCDQSRSITITLSTGGSGSFATRKMTGPGGVTLSYNLYTTSGLATIWGNGSSGTGTVTGNVGTTATSFTIWGSIPKNQYTAVAGTYTDSVTASVTP
jgi:spore coat protein U-like protein